MTTTIGNAERLVPCSFCEEELSPLKMGTHLMMCGNRTDQCPNCRKYIRRAIFAYHYENNCADLDDFDDDDDGADANQSDVSSTVQPNHSSQSSLGLNYRNNKQITLMDVDLASHSTLQTATSQRSTSGIVTTMVCPFCEYECDPADSLIHQEKCLRNPKNTTKKQQLQSYPTTTQISERLDYADQSDTAADIPCEYCNKPIRWRDYENHTRACETQQYQRIQQQPQYGSRIDAPASARCQYCGKQYMMITFEHHQRNCKQNPINIAAEEQYKNIYRTITAANTPFY